MKTKLSLDGARDFPKTAQTFLEQDDLTDCNYKYWR